MITMTNGLNATTEFKQMYNRFIDEIFGFTFEPWFALGVWGDEYEVYSIIEAERIIANVSVFRAKLLIHGEEREFLQFGAVGTVEDHRGQGLSRLIMEHILRIYPRSPGFLYANDEVTGYYPRFGFRAIAEKQPFSSLEGESARPLPPLSISDPKVDWYLRQRSVFSEVLDCTNAYAINWFHIQGSFSRCLYEVPELGVMLVARERGEVLSLYDVVATRPLSFADLRPYLNFPGAREVRFWFNPDWLGVEYQMRELKLEDSTLFLRGEFGVQGEYTIPVMLKT